MGAMMMSSDSSHGSVEATRKGSGTSSKNKVKVPRRVHKSEREKLKREQLNDLFEHLAATLEMEPPNNGKASVLNETARMLKNLLGQINTLKKENASLVSESHYVTIEKNELKEENSVLETQIGDLRSKVRARLVHTKPDLNIPPPKFEQQPETTAGLAPHFLGCPSVVLPIDSNLQYLSVIESNVSKPHASWVILGRLRASFRKNDVDGFSEHDETL
ncbi:Transcription factor bHLH47 [Linum perenne]